MLGEGKENGPFGSFAPPESIKSALGGGGGGERSHSPRVALLDLSMQLHLNNMQVDEALPRVLAHQTSSIDFVVPTH